MVEVSESLVNDYISREIITKPELLPLNNETRLLESGIIDSLSLLKLVLFLEQKFGVVVGAEELVPENFQTVSTICTFLRTKNKS